MLEAAWTQNDPKNEDYLPTVTGLGHAPTETYFEATVALAISIGSHSAPRASLMRITSTPLSRAMSSAARNDMISLVSWRVSDAKQERCLKMTFSECQNYIILMNTPQQIIISWFNSKKWDENGRESWVSDKISSISIRWKKEFHHHRKKRKNNNWPLQLHSTLPRPRSDLDRHQQSQPPALHWHGFPHSPCTPFFQACSKSWLRHTIAHGCCQRAITYTNKSRHAHEWHLEFSRNPSYY